MRVSLLWQVLWAPALALAVAGVLLAAEMASRSRLTDRLGDVTLMRESLERSLARLADRHERTLRRVNEAVLEPRPAARDAILAWTAEHYVKEMDRYAAEARAAAAAAEVRGADARLPDDLRRFEAQVTRIREQARSIGPTIDALMSAVAAEDAEAVLAATQDLERADRAMAAVLRTADAVVRRTAVWQTEQALTDPPAVPPTAWVLLLVWAPLSLYIAQRPLRRVGRLALGPPVPARHASAEEEALATRVAALEAARDGLARQLADRAREADRAANVIRRVDQELALLKLYSENLVNSIRAAIVVTDAALRVRSFNRAARELLGMSEAAMDAPLSSHPLHDAIALRATEPRGELVRAMDERRALRFESLPYSAPRGEVLLDLVIAPYMDESGAARGLIFVADDVTEAVHTKTQLLAAERLAAVGRLSAQVAHEIRNPLSAIGLNAELLGDDFAQDLEEPRRTEAATLLRAIAAEVERLTEVTEGYLQLTRLPHPSLRAVDVNQLTSDVASMLREEMKLHGVTVELELASPAPVAWMDPGQLRQALLNILRNGREAMPSGGTIRISTRRAADQVVIEVADSGPGIPRDVLPRVFEPFFSTKTAGTGLGLSLTEQIVGEHGGTIRVENGPQGGARVTIMLPHDREAADSQARASGSA